jgi:hypothetical protein
MTDLFCVVRVVLARASCAYKEHRSELNWILEVCHGDVSSCDALGAELAAFT